MQPNSKGCGEERLEFRLKLVEMSLRTATSSMKATLDRVLTQDVVEDVVKQLRCSSALLPYPILYGEGRRKLPVYQDGAFRVAVKFFE